MEKLLNKGDRIQSRRTGKILECYHIMSVHRGAMNKIVAYEYRFIDEQKKSKTIKGNVLAQMLENAWVKI